MAKRRLKSKAKAKAKVKVVDDVFYESERYKKTMEVIHKHMDNYCLGQIKLRGGGVLEKYLIGGSIVIVLCEPGSYSFGDADRFSTEVYAPATLGNKWSDLDEAMAEIKRKKPYKLMLDRLIGACKAMLLHRECPVGSAEAKSMQDIISAVEGSPEMKKD